MATTVSISAGPTSPSGVTTDTFNSGVPANYTLSGPYAGIVSGDVFNVYRAPAGDSTPYLYVGPNSLITASYAAAPITTFGLYWSTIDDYNSIAFTDVNGITTTFLPTNIFPVADVNTATSLFVTFTDSGAAWKSVAFLSSITSFEFDNVSAGSTSASPEPASIALLAGGLLTVGILRRRKSK